MSTAPLHVLLHGVPTHSALWNGVRAELPSHSVLTPDLPGYGAATNLRDPSIETHTDWLEATLDTVDPTGAQPVHLVGQDYGGLLAACLAARRPSRRVLSVTLISAAVGLSWTWARIGALPGPHLLFYRAFGGRLFHHQGIAPHARSSFRATFGPSIEDPELPERMRWLARGLSVRQLTRLPRQLAESGTPLRFIAGSSDRFVPLPTVLYTAHRHRKMGAHARTTVILGGRHYLPWGRPGATARALREFWSETTG